MELQQNQGMGRQSETASISCLLFLIFDCDIFDISPLHLFRIYFPNMYT